VALKGQTRDPNTLRAQYLENYLSSRLQIWYAALYRECRAGAQIILPESGRGQGHVIPTIFGSTVGYPSDSLASCLFSSQLYSYSAAKLTSDYVPVTMSTLCKKEAALSQGNRVMSQVF